MARVHIPGPLGPAAFGCASSSYFLLLSGVTVASVGVVVYVRATQDLTASEYDRLAAVAEVKADSIDRLDRRAAAQRRVRRRDPGVRRPGSRLPRPEHADRGQVGRPEDPRRRARRRRPPDRGCPGVPRPRPRRERPPLDGRGARRGLPGERAVLHSGSSHTYVQNAYTSTLTGEPTITISTPLFDANGKGRRVGVLAANLNLERIDRIVLESTGLGEGGATYLVGPDKRFLHARLNQGAYASGVSSQAIDAALAGQDGEALYTDYAGVPVIGVYRWLKAHDAALIVELPQGTAFAPAEQLALTIGIVGLLSALLLAVGMWLIARQVTRPILRLASTATAVAGGDLTATAPVTSRTRSAR